MRWNNVFCGLTAANDCLIIQARPCSPAIILAFGEPTDPAAPLALKSEIPPSHHRSMVDPD
jgi:hypothetical protein